jgi:Glycine/D-amino acid oxidases (deaminating)
MTNVLTDNFKHQPYWWDAAPLEPIETTTTQRDYDVAIVGSGFTGLVAALTLLRGGRSVVIFDKELAGYGASRRNAGFLGRVLKKSFGDLMEDQGKPHALAVYTELNASLDFVFELTEREQIECYAQRCGRFIAADSTAHYQELGAELQLLQEHVGLPYAMIPDARSAGEFTSPRWNRGAVVPDLGSIHPGLYHKGLLDRVLVAGGVVLDQTLVTAPNREGQRHVLETSRGRFSAQDVIMATNGYTTRDHGWHARRVVPFEGFMAATEPLDPSLLERVLPHGRTVLNSRTNIDFFRPAPDQPRILFGGSTGSPLRNAEAIGTELHRTLVETLPELAGTLLSHVWSGHCAGTFDMMPHMGKAHGIWFGMGYNFAGVPMGSYFGKRIAEHILGTSSGPSVFEQTAFRPIPLYDGRPWFMPLVMRYFDWKDDRKAASKPKQQELTP